MRRLLARAVPEKEEINILRGMLAALEHPLPGAPSRQKPGDTGGVAPQSEE
jgi:tRNA C32,U32 (ribose-2'-O)-methylase TrmJ